MKRAPSSQFPDLPSVTVKPHGQKRLDHGHPWVYSNEVEMDAAAKAVPPGGLVRLCDAQGRYRATAFFNRHPLIAARVLTRAETVAIDTEFLTRRDRKSVVKGQGVSVRVSLGVRRNNKKKTQKSIT